MVGKWWGGIARFLGELGGSTGRAIGAWKGAGLLEKKEEVLLNSEERIGERIAGGRPWNWALSPGCQSTPSGSLSRTLLSGNWRIQRKKEEVAQVEESCWNSGFSLRCADC